MKITVTLLNGSKVDYLSDLTSVLIGRSETAQFRISDPGLSRQHALIENEEGAFFVTDLGSSNGVYVDGQKIAVGTKVAFSNFQTLALGPLECIVLENNPSSVIPTELGPMKSLKRDLSGETITRVMIDRKDARVAFKKQKKNESTLFLTAISIIICAAGFYYFKQSDETKNTATEKNVSTTPALSQNTSSLPVPVPVTPAEDKFLTKEIYAERFEKRSCRGYEEICRDLQLDDKDSEGVLEREGEYFIYLNSMKRNNKVFSAFDTDPTKADIISLYTILKSNFYNKLAANTISQIHLILINQDSKLYRVYRFKISHLGKSRIELLKEIKTGITLKNSEKFWTMAHEKIPLMDLLP